MSAGLKRTISFSTPWLHKAWFDSLFILFPPIFSVALVFLFLGNFEGTGSVPLWAWIVFVLGIDVAHVYSTLFRTYFNAGEFSENKTALVLVPAAVWVVGVLLYSMSAKLFWSGLAYLAVFHFIRQQYGFIRLYSRTDTQTQLDRKVDALVVYVGTLYPIVYWHAHLPRNFAWFMEGDFLLGLPLWAERAAFVLYVLTIAIYFSKEVRLAVRERTLNPPKNMIVIGTLLSWYVGIVLFNGDMVFTITNILSHGIPYLALVWAYGRKTKATTWSQNRIAGPLLRSTFSRYGTILFLAVLISLAYLEEGLWAGFVWREHLEFFGIFSGLPKLTDRGTLAWVVPLLALPQATHYVLDGFIWKLKNDQASWQKTLFDRKVGAA